MQHHTDRRKHNQDCKTARRIHREVTLQQEVAEPGLRTNELANDGANDREHNCDIETGEDERQR